MMNHQKTKYPQRVRNELRFRELTVLRVERIGTAFQRVVLGGEALEGFVSQGFDDHTKLFFPASGTTFVPPAVTDEGIIWADGPRPASRDYTPLYSEARHELAYDFFIHDGGVASEWAMQVKAGDRLTIAGPRGSLVVPKDYGWQLYVCDESGMPALRRRLESLRQQATRPKVKAIVTVADAAWQDYLEDSEFEIDWIVGHEEGAIAAGLGAVTVPSEDYFIWITGEGAVVKSLLDDFITDDINPHLVRSQAYWHRK